MKPEGHWQEQSGNPAQGKTTPRQAGSNLWEDFLSRENLAQALRRVEQNGGAPGIDDMNANELRQWLFANWPQVRDQLVTGTYKPQPVRRVTIPKPSGGKRNLGVPTAVDRMIQQALLQVLTPIFDPHFSDHSYGFRPNRSAHQAVAAARQSVQDGLVWAVDVDLDSFFDRVGHDSLMARVARTVDDKKVLRLIRAYLNAGAVQDGVKQQTEQGVPQGSPLSPLLANIMRGDLDKVLEKRGHSFVRYADDLMIYVKSRRAGERVMNSTTQFIEKRLKLQVNSEKSAVGRATKRTLLGFGFFVRGGEVKVRIDPKARERAKDRIRELTSRRWGISVERRIRELNRFTTGWTAYFALADTPSAFDELDEWLRRRMRQVKWKQWKRIRTKRRELIAHGIPIETAHQWACSRKGYWRMAGSAPLQRALPNAYWDKIGLRGFANPYRQVRSV